MDNLIIKRWNFVHFYLLISGPLLDYLTTEIALHHFKGKEINNVIEKMHSDNFLGLLAFRAVSIILTLLICYYFKYNEINDRIIVKITSFNYVFFQNNYRLVDTKLKTKILVMNCLAVYAISRLFVGVNNALEILFSTSGLSIFSGQILVIFIVFLAVIALYFLHGLYFKQQKPSA